MTCGSTTQVPGIFNPVSCELGAGHSGRHRGYMAQVDEPVFWGASAPRSVDPNVYALAETFVDDVLFGGELPHWAGSESDRARLVQRAAEAMQIAIEQECESIREELADVRSYADAVDSGTGPSLERDR